MMQLLSIEYLEVYNYYTFAAKLLNTHKRIYSHYCMMVYYVNNITVATYTR